jgi:hypothetical protein
LANSLPCHGRVKKHACQPCADDLEIAPGASTEYCCFQVIHEHREHAGLKQTMPGEITEFHCRLSGLTNGFGNARGQGEGDGSGPLGRRDGAFVRWDAGFLANVNQSSIFAALGQSSVKVDELDRGVGKFIPAQRRALFRCLAANSNSHQSSGIVWGDRCRPLPISKIARIYKAKHRIVAASE